MSTWSGTTIFWSCPTEIMPKCRPKMVLLSCLGISRRDRVEFSNSLYLHAHYCATVSASNFSHPNLQWLTRFDFRNLNLLFGWPGSYLFVLAPFAQTQRRSTEAGRPDTVVEVGEQSVHCCVARGVRSIFFFSAGVGKTIFRIFFLRRCFVPGILHFSTCLWFEYRAYFFENGTTLPQLCVPCAKTGLGYMIMQVWGGCVPHVVCHACMCRAQCDAFFLTKKHKPPVQIDWAQLWVWGLEFKPRQALLFFFIFVCIFFCIAFFLFNFDVFAQTLVYVFIYLLERLATALASLRRDRFDIYILHPSFLGACVVGHACMCRV